MKRSGRAAWRLSFLVLCVLALIPRSPLTRAYGGETLSPIADNAAWDDYYVGGEGALVTNDYVTPANSVRITTLERYNYNGLSKELFSAPLNLSGKSLLLFLKSSDWSKVAGANILFGSDGYTLNNTYTFDLRAALTAPTNGNWIRVEMPLSAFERYGAPDWSRINFAMIRLKDAGTVADLSFDGLASYVPGAPAVTATPAFSPAGGNFTAVQNVSLSDATPGAVIYFTLDGTTPTTASTRYAGAIPISSSLTLKAMALAPGYAASAVVSAAYTINLPLPVAAAPTISPNGGTFSSAQTVTLVSSTPGANIRYTLDGTAPTSASPLYCGPLSLNATATLKALATASGHSNSPVASALFTITAPAGKFTYLAEDTAWDNFYVGTEGSVSTTDKVVGASSVKITTRTRSAYNGISKEFIAPLDLSRTGLRFFVKAANWNTVAVANLMLGSDGYGFGNTYTYDLKGSLQNPANGQWIEVVVPRSAFEKYGNPDWSRINLALLRIQDSGRSTSLSLDGLSAFDASAPEGIVSITFDDGWADTFTVGKAKMDAYGYTGTAFLMPAQLNTAGYLTTAQVDALGNGGWDLGGHSARNLTTLSSTALSTDVAAAYNYVHGRRGGNLFAYPNGAANNAVMAQVGSRFSFAYNINGMNQPLTYMNKSSINRQSMDKWTTVEMIKAWIDQARENREWCILNFHTLVATPVQSYDFSISDFVQVLDYLKATGTTVKPASEVMSAYAG